MSGGSLSYLYNKEFPEVCNYIGEMKKVEKELISQGYTDIARDVRRLIEYCLTAENRISVLFDNLSDVFHAVEWYYSSDYGEDTLIKELDRYRAGQFKTDAEVFDEKIVHIEKPIEISSHMGARPKCAPYQGKVFSRKGQSGVAYDGKGDAVTYSPLSETSYGQPDGIFGINCRHKKYPFVSGANFRTYFPYDEEENAERYKATQKQRYMERRVREASREAELLEIAGDEQGAKEARLKAKNRRAEYRKYCADNGLKVRNDRLAVVKNKG